MATFRNVNMSFWTDTKVLDDYTPEEKLLFLYLLTNPHTNLCGCYEISISQMALEIGYKKETVKKLIARLQDTHKSVIYAEDTKEMLLLNWHKYNWTASEKFRKPLMNQILCVKDERFKTYLLEIFDGADTVSIPYRYGIDTTEDISEDTSVESSEGIKRESNNEYRQVVDYLNQKAGTAFRDKSRDTRSHIKARFDEGFQLSDFYKVIDNKVAEWKGTDMEKYLRPSTLFGTKFESYLNQKATRKKVTNFDNFEPRQYDYDALELELLKAQGAI